MEDRRGARRRFATRASWDLQPNPLARLRQRSAPIPYDLTVSNPTQCGFPYPADLLRSLASPEGLIYRPEPAGLAAAREAVAAEYSRRGYAVDASRVVLSASTSEAYSFLFKLLGDPGDGVLLPSPSYPLLEHLASLEGLRPVCYRLDEDGQWQPNVAELAREETARIVVAVHPNNPTGSYLHPGTARALVAACGGRGKALVVDEVFFPYPLAPSVEAVSFVTSEEALTFTLGGLSKTLGLPQLKLAWIVVGGPREVAEEARDRLLFLADQYLSVNTPVQLALPGLFAEASSVHHAIVERCRKNLPVLQEAVRTVPGVTVPTPEAGWSAVVRFPAVVEEEALAAELLERHGVAVHPGYFFDFARPGHVVVSLLPPLETFAEGVTRLIGVLASNL